MEKDFVSWFHHQYPDLQSAHSNFRSRGLNIGQQNSAPIYMTPYSNEVLLRQGFAPVLSTIVKEKLVPQSVDLLGGNKEANAGPGSAQKRFLVFDQSGDQTTLLYSSPNGTPVQCLPSWHQKPLHPVTSMEGPQIKRNGICPSGHYSKGEYYEENHRDDVESELHEDTEELNALLYSDDDDSCSRMW
ncbi:hypothetical protein HAX54_019290 [Datura stramonium]|uniref:Uncharacterized protein n=1 Tax=Datura stramonium TaxID=4076 RepID=A0ABS8UNU8_DATST|nr:hypothetical protein [Datura stramonium]